MWKEISKFFEPSPAKLRVAKLMVELGLGIDDEMRIVCGIVRVPDLSIARAAGVDRRAVRGMVEDVVGNPRMKEIFGGLKPAGSFLRDVAPTLGYSVIEIRADPASVGVIAKTTAVIADAKLVIRQILAEDPDLNPDPKLLIITSRPVPGDVVSKLLAVPTVTKVSLS